MKPLNSSPISAAKARVFVLYTGGTIGMAPEDDSVTGSPLVPKSLDELKEYAGILDTEKNPDYQYGEWSFDPPLDSSNITPKNWIEIAEKIAEVYDDYDGFVVLHGTDTMSYTSSALSFLLENLDKPVVITGSQLPISAPRSDAELNLSTAIYVAGYKASGLPRVPEVMIVFADKILRGCRATKVSSMSLAGFDSPNFPPLGQVGEHIKIRTEFVRPMPSLGQKFRINRELDNSVMDISLFPGMRTAHLKLLLDQEDITGIVLRTYGTGNAPTNQDFLQTIEEAAKKQKIIVNITRCVEGMVEMGLYEASAGLLERGVISGLDMTPEAALTKLMWTLSTKLGTQVATQMQVSARGELSENLFDLRYGGVEKPESKYSNFVTPDRRLQVPQLNRGVVRLSGLALEGVNINASVTLRIFMNMPRAHYDDHADKRLVAEMATVWKGEKTTLLRIINDENLKSSIGEGDITLTVVAPEGIKFTFDGLYLALFAKA